MLESDYYQVLLVIWSLKQATSLSTKQKRKYPYFIRQLFRKHGGYTVDLKLIRLMKSRSLVDRKTKHAVNKYETEFEQHLIVEMLVVFTDMATIKLSPKQALV